MGGIEEVKKVAPRLEQHDPFVVQTITATMLEAGDVETLDEFMNRFEKIKKQYHIELLVPALEAIVDMIIKGDKMPPKLLKAFSNEPVMAQPTFVAPQQPVKAPAFAVPPQQQFVPPQQPPIQPAQFVPPQQPAQPVQAAPVVPPPQPPIQPASDQSSEDSQLGIDFSDILGGDLLGEDIPMAQEQTEQPVQPDLTVDPNQMLPQLDLSDNGAQEAQNTPDLNLDANTNEQPAAVNLDVSGFVSSASSTMSTESDMTLPLFQDLSELEIPNAPEVPIKKKPAAPHYKAGLKAYNLGKYQKAIEEFNKSIASNESCPANIDLYLGIMYSEEHEYEEAKKHLVAFLKTTPDNSKANYLLGKCYKKTKDWQSVIDTYQLFVQGELDATPKMKKRIHQDMGTACAILGKSEMAVRLLNNLFKLESDNAEIGYYLAMAYYKMKKTSEASVIIEKAAKVAPQGKPIEKQIASLAQIIRSGLPLT